MYPAHSSRGGLGVAIVGCQSVTGSGEADSGEEKCSIGARYQRWICCSTVARLCFDGLISLPQARDAVVTNRMWLGCSIGVCLVKPIGGPT